MAGKIIYGILSNETIISDKVGDKIFPTVAPENTKPPYIVYNILYTDPTKAKKEKSTVDRLRVQVDVWANTYPSAYELGEVIRAAMDQFSGEVAGEKVDNIVFENQQDRHDEELELFGQSCDFFIRKINS